MEADAPASVLPSKFIKIVSHPHSAITEPTIISLERESVENTCQKTPVFTRGAKEPWFPFCTRADFEYAETAIKGLLSKHMVDAQLRGINHGWAEQSKITFQSHTDMEKTLGAARAYDVEVTVYTITDIPDFLLRHQRLTVQTWTHLGRI